MIIDLDLPPDLEAKLNETAKQRDITVENLVIELLQAYFENLPEEDIAQSNDKF